MAKPITIRRLVKTDDDRAMRYFRKRDDPLMILAFVERYQKLGWLPPSDPKTARLLREYGIQTHAIRNHWFYEFVLQGGRGERQPWITVFFHLDTAANLIRLCGVEETAIVERRRQRVLQMIGDRVCWMLDLE